MIELNEPNVPSTATRLKLVAHIVSAFISNNAVPVGDLPKLIADTHRSLESLASPNQQPVLEVQAPAVSIKKSITPDFLVCLDDGKKFKSLKLHLSKLGMTPAEYRTKWGLPSDYPMVAPNYAVKRSAMAKSHGLGRNR